MSLIYGEPDPQSASARRASQSVAPIATPASEISQQSNREPVRNATRATPKRKVMDNEPAIHIVSEICTTRGSTFVSDSSAEHGKRLKLDSVSQSIPTGVGKMESSIREATAAVEAMSSEEEVRIHEIRQLILANEPDKEYEFELSFSSYEKLKAEFVKDEENEDYPRLFYDWTRHEITIVTVPSRLHEDTSRAILDCIYNRAQSIIERERINLPADEMLGITSSPRTLVNNRSSRFHIEPDGLIFFETVDSVDFKVVVEVGISQTYDSLLNKAKKWIFGMKCNIVILIAFNEKRSYSASRKRLPLTSRQVDDQVVRMRRHWLSPSASEFGPLVFQGHTYFDEIEEGFIEIVRMGKDAGGIDNLSKDKYVLVRDGVNEGHSVPWSAGHILLAELIPPASLGSEAAGDLVVDFFGADHYMRIVRHAMVGTAVERFKDAVHFTD